MLLYDWVHKAARNRGSEKALVYRDSYLSWRGLSHRVDRRAVELQIMGIGGGDWVGVMLGNIPEFVVLALAVAKLGGVVVPLDPTLGSRDLDLILSVVPIRALVTRPRGGESAALGAPEEQRTKRGRSPQVRRRLQGTLLTCNIYADPEIDAPGDAEVVLITTDSAGDVRGVLRSNAELVSLTDQIAKTLSIRADDRIVGAVPFYGAFGFDFALAPAFRYGATLFLEDELSEKRILKILREHEASLMAGIPTLYRALCRQPTARKLKTRSARFLSAGGALDSDLVDGFYKRYGVRVLSCYQTTEGGPVSVDLGGQNPETVGKPFRGVEVRVDGSDRKGGEVGDGPIWVRSKAISRQLVGGGSAIRSKDGQTAVGSVTSSGWLRTGDVGHLDRAGRLVLSGREDQVVKVEGRHIALGEVEACIEGLSRVAAAQARVVTDAMGGSVVVARVVARGRIGAEEIIDHCAKTLAPYKVPRRIEFCRHLG